MQQLRSPGEWLDQIEGVRDFVGFTPQSFQELAAERVLLRALHENDSWDRVDDAFHASLLPEGKVVLHKALCTRSLVIKAYSVVVVLWPMVQIVPNAWQCSQDITELTWTVCFDIDEYLEVPMEYASPLHLALEAPWLSSAMRAICRHV